MSLIIFCTLRAFLTHLVFQVEVRMLIRAQDTTDSIKVWFIFRTVTQAIIFFNVFKKKAKFAPLSVIQKRLDAKASVNGERPHRLSRIPTKVAGNFSDDASVDFIKLFIFSKAPDAVLHPIGHCGPQAVIKRLYFVPHPALIPDNPSP